MDQILNQQIQQLYTLQHDVNHRDRNIFNHSLSDLTQKSIAYKTQWIENTRQTVYQCVEDHNEKQKSGQKDIRQHFQPATQTSK